MVKNLNFPLFSCSFRLFSTPNDDQDSNLRSQSFSQDSFNSSFSSRSSLPSSISAVLPPSTALHHHCLFTITPNSSHILSLTLAGNHLFSGSSNAQIHRWPLHHHHTTATATTISGEEEITSIQCNSPVKCLQTLNDDTIISAHQDHKIRIWKIYNLNTRNNCNIRIVTTLPTLKDRLSKVFFAKNYVTVRRRKKLTWVHHSDAVSSLAVAIDGSLIYSGSWDRSFKVWRTSDYRCLESVSNAHDDAINAIVVSDEGVVYTGSADKKIKIWRFNRSDRKHELMSTLVHHKSAVNSLAYDDNSSVLISGACSGVMIASERSFSGGSDGEDMVVVGALLGHKKAILCVRIVGGLVCSGSADKTVRLWRRMVAKRYMCVGVLEGHGGPVKCLTVAVESSGDGDGRECMVYSGGLDCDIKVWKVWVPFVMGNLDG